MATLTSTTYDKNPAKFLHAGNVTVQGRYSFAADAGAAASVGDIVWLCKVPNGAKIVDFYEYHSANASAMAASFGFDRGIAAGGAGNLSCLLASGAQATTNRMALSASSKTGNMPETISISDLDPVRYVALACKLEGPNTGTTSVYISWSLTFRMDNPDTQ